MSAPKEDFIPLSIREFRKLKNLADSAVSQISEREFFSTLGEQDNSVAQIYKHVSGNLISRWTDFLTADGEKADRNRDQEFIVADSDSFITLKENWEKGWRTLFDTLAPLEDEDLKVTVRIRGEGLSVLQAISRQLTHYGYHVGQIVFLAKHHAGKNWQSLSIPIGKSEEFNKAPKKYLPSDSS